jgi:hypothetical protein
LVSICCGGEFGYVSPTGSDQVLKSVEYDMPIERSPWLEVVPPAVEPAGGLRRRSRIVSEGMRRAHIKQAIRPQDPVDYRDPIRELIQAFRIVRIPEYSTRYCTLKERLTCCQFTMVT